jgi:hypothetical protein
MSNQFSNYQGAIANQEMNEEAGFIIGGNVDSEEEKVLIPSSELDLLQSCQKIIDAASSMKCIMCEKIFMTTDFYDHIIVQQECIIESEEQS